MYVLHNHKNSKYQTMSFYFNKISTNLQLTFICSDIFSAQMFENCSAEPLKRLPEAKLSLSKLSKKNSFFNFILHILSLFRLILPFQKLPITAQFKKKPSMVIIVLKNRRNVRYSKLKVRQKLKSFSRERLILLKGKSASE